MIAGRPMADQLRRTTLRLLHAYESVQVELHGNYSVERMIKLDEYVSTCSLVWAVAVLMVTPLPSLVATVLADTVPLRPASEGLAGSQLFWWRVVLVSSCVTFAILEQLRAFIPRLPNASRTMTIAVSACIGVGCSAYGILMASIVGFPLPFTLAFGSPMWQVLFWGYVGIKWGTLLYGDRLLRLELVSFYKVVIVQLSLTLIYPIYNYGFTLLDGASQTAFALLLPMIKIGAKNAFSSVFIHSEDFRPEVVIFNVEIFHALFVSTCMQSSTSLLTTAVLMATDVLQAWLHVRDIDSLLSIIQAFDAKGKSNVQTRSSLSTPLKTALIFVALDTTLQHDPDIRMRVFDPSDIPRDQGEAPTVSDTTRPGRPPIPTTSVYPINLRAQPLAGPVLNRPASPDDDVAKILHRLSRKLSEKDSTDQSMLSHAERREYVATVLRILHFMEFLVLIEFVEVVVPLVYGSYLLAVFQLPNHVYYPTLARISEATLWARVTNIFTYAALELLSFVAICWVLERKLRMSPVKQLVFVLHKQWQLVQSKMLLWVLVVVQTSLEQFGYDYTFKFAWLKTPRGS